jgi:regulator of sirC expression with transglutaminase-like and TPR domain
MSSPADIRAEFARLMAGPDDSIDLGRAALLVAAGSDPRCDVDACVRTLDEWGRTLADRIAPDWNNLQKLARLRALLFDDLQFRGDRKTYHAPENSLLHQVMERRLGIPLTLSIVFMEVGRRVGIPFEGVGFPGHFLVRLTGEPKDLLLDPFWHGQSVHEEDCRSMLEQAGAGATSFRPELIAGVTKRMMIARLLSNLKGAYLRADDEAGALSAVERLLILHPDDAVEVRDHGLLLYRQGQFASALRELRRYLTLAPDAENRAEIERHVAILLQQLALMN